MDAPKIVPQKEVKLRLQEDIEVAFQSIDEQLPLLGHSEAKRLFIAATKYPLEIADFGEESEPMIKAFSASKNVKDALIALGVEVVIEQMLRQQQEQNNAPVILEADKVEKYNESLDSLITESGWEDVKLEQETKAAPKKRSSKKV